MKKRPDRDLSAEHGTGSDNDSGSSSRIEPSWPAPGKLNLFLHVTGRRRDGYHMLQTVFQFLDFYDTLDFDIRKDDRITLSTNYADAVTGEDLILRAAKMLQQASPGAPGVDIQAHKRLPVGGGLGGGSSNAATTLVALNTLWRSGKSIGELAEMGLALGADIPVFVHGHAAWAEGIGEQLTHVDPPQDWYLVVNPGFSVSTAEIFNARDLTRNTPAITIRDFLEGQSRNDCEPVVSRIYPELAEVLGWLRDRAPARLTGTGSCVYAVFKSEMEAKHILASLPPPLRGFVAQGLNRSPLLDRLRRETDG